MRRIRSRLPHAGVVAATVVALLVPAAPVAANGNAWTFTAGPVNVTRGGVKYQMTITATQSAGGEDAVTVSLARTVDPAGVRVSTQQHSYRWTLKGDRFVPAANLASATLATARQMGIYGSLNLKFAKTDPLRRRCDGALKTREGKVTGKVAFKTGTKKFGTIRDVPAKGLLVYSDGSGTCDSVTLKPTGGCPTSGVFVSGTRTDGAKLFQVLASKPAKGPAFISVSWSGPLPKTAATQSHGVYASVPRTKVVVASDLGNGTITGVKGTSLSGKATFAATTPAMDPWTAPCAKGKQSATTLRTGSLRGTLKANFWLGPDAGIGSGAMQGSAMRQTVLAA